MSSENNPELARNASLAGAGMAALLSASLDDLDDLPSFDCPPPGVYVVSLTTEQKEVNNKEAIEASYTIKEVVELKDPTGTTPPVPGSKFSTLFTLNEYGIGMLKKFCAPFGKHFNTNSVGELINDKLKDVLCTVVVGNKKDKEDPEKVYPIVKIASIS